MKFIYILIYTLVLVFVWGFFIVLKLHTQKFRNFSSYISPITFILLIFLIVLSVLGYACIFFIGGNFTSKASLSGIEDISEQGKSFDDLNLNEINY